jgi:serine/threonine-protein kinase
LSLEGGIRLKASQALGRFRILDQVGEGGMGRIYAAWDTAFDRKVALKMRNGAPGAERAQLETEARALATLSHPNVVRLFEFCELDGEAFIVMEYLEGTTLRALLKKGPPSNETCFDVGAQIVKGLAAIHRQAIVHLDLKPENVQVLPSGRVKILDLGLSLRLGPGYVDGPRRATPNGVCGTMPYMSPEQLRGGSVDVRSDIFSFGVILHEMQTGQLPVIGLEPSLVEGSTLREIVLRCLRERREERYRSSLELAIAICRQRALLGA